MPLHTHKHTLGLNSLSEDSLGSLHRCELVYSRGLLSGSSFDSAPHTTGVNAIVERVLKNLLLLRQWDWRLQYPLAQLGNWH